MATLYTRIYTYTGQGKWTADARTTPWSSFKETGDTDHSIGQLVSIQYEHYHASTSSRTWALAGQLTLSDGTTIQSDSVSKYISGNSDVIKFVNTFTSLPSVSQFGSIASVQTLADGTSANNGVLTWRADSARPMRVIVSYYEEPPWVYHPQVESFELKRGTSDGVQDDSGTRALLTMKLSLASSSYASLSDVKLYYSTGTVSASSSYYDLTGYISALLSGVSNNNSYISGTFDTDYDWNFLLVFSCGGEEAVASATLPNSAVMFHVSENGVAVGDQCTNTDAANPIFECHLPAALYGGIVQIGSSSADTLTALGVQAGQVAPVSVELDGYQGGTVTFAKAFSAVPSLATTLITDTESSSSITGYQGGECAVFIRNVTTTSFEYRIINGRGSARNLGFNWVAVGASTGSSSGGSGGSSGGDSGDDEGGGTGAESTPASRTELGAVKVGSGLNIASDGTISASGTYTQYTNQTNMGLITLGDTSGYQNTITIPLPAYRMLRTTDYGESLPTSGLYNGRLFFLKK